MIHERHLMDELMEKSAKLSAMLTAIYGDGFDHFIRINSEIQHNYLWACADIAHDIDKLAKTLTET